MSDSLLFDLQQELAATKQKLALVLADVQFTQAKFEGTVQACAQMSGEARALKKRAEAAEQAIRESQEQEPVFYYEVCTSNKNITVYEAEHSMMYSTRISVNEPPPTGNLVFKLYAKPVIIPQSAEQLHIKELVDSIAKLRHMIYMGETTASCFDIADKALAKQPDTRALDKALIEAEIKVLETAYRSGVPYSVEFSHMINERKAKLTEFNKA